MHTEGRVPHPSKRLKGTQHNPNGLQGEPGYAREESLTAKADREYAALNSTKLLTWANLFTERKETYKKQLEGGGYDTDKAMQLYINEQFRILAKHLKEKRAAQEAKKKKEKAALEARQGKKEGGEKTQTDKDETEGASGNKDKTTIDNELVLTPDEIKKRWDESEKWLKEKATEI